MGGGGRARLFLLRRARARLGADLAVSRAGDGARARYSRGGRLQACTSALTVALPLLYIYLTPTPTLTLPLPLPLPLTLTLTLTLTNQAAEHYYLLTEPMASVGKGWPVVEDPSRHTYIRPEGGGLMVGWG